MASQAASAGDAQCHLVFREPRFRYVGRVRLRVAGHHHRRRILGVGWELGDHSAQVAPQRQLHWSRRWAQRCRSGRISAPSRTEDYEVRLLLSLPAQADYLGGKARGCRGGRGSAMAWRWRRSWRRSGCGFGWGADAERVTSVGATQRSWLSDSSKAQAGMMGRRSECPNCLVPKGIKYS